MLLIIERSSIVLSGMYSETVYLEEASVGQKGEATTKLAL